MAFLANLASFASVFEVAFGLNIGFGLITQVNQAGYHSFIRKKDRLIEDLESEHPMPEKTYGDGIDDEIRKMQSSIIESLKADWKIREVDFHEKVRSEFYKQVKFVAVPAASLAFALLLLGAINWSDDAGHWSWWSILLMCACLVYMIVPVLYLIRRNFLQWDGQYEAFLSLHDAYKKKIDEGIKGIQERRVTYKEGPEADPSQED